MFLPGARALSRSNMIPVGGGSVGLLSVCGGGGGELREGGYKIGRSDRIEAEKNALRNR